MSEIDTGGFEYGYNDMKWVGTQFNPLSVNPTKWSDTIKKFVGFFRQIV